MARTISAVQGNGSLFNKSGLIKRNLSGDMNDGFANVRHYSDATIADGTTDARAAIAAADAAGPVKLPPGTYVVASNLTLTKKITFLPGAKLKPASGVTITLDDGYVANNEQHVFDISDGGVIVLTKKHPVTVENWGAVGDGTADDSIPGQAALDATRNVELLAKTYRATWVLNPNAEGVSIKGRKTRLFAANNNEFALTLAGNYPGAVCRISEIDFFCPSPLRQRHGLQITTGSAVFVDNCWFSYCGIGLCINSTIELRFNSCWFRENYVAHLMTTRLTGNLDVGNIEGQTVTLHNATLGGQHPTENSFIGMIYNSNTFAVVMEQPDNPWPSYQDLLFVKCVIQYGKIGLLTINKSTETLGTSTVLQSFWCEGNARDTFNTYDGVDYQGGDIVASVGNIVVNNSIIECVRASNTADVSLYKCDLNEFTQLFKTDNATITTEKCYAYRVVVDQPTDVHYSGIAGLAAMSKSYTPIGISYSLANDDRLLLSKTCYEGDQPGAWLATVLGTFEDGVLPVNQCVGYRAATGQGVLIPFATTEDGKYSIRFSVKAHCPAITFTANSTTDVFTSVAHGLANGMQLNATTTGTLPAGMDANTVYTVLNKTDDTFQLSAPLNLRMTSISTYLDYDDEHTVIGAGISGDFVIEWNFPNTHGIDPSQLIGVSTATSPTAGFNYNNFAFGIQPLTANSVKVWIGSTEAVYSATWVSGDVRLTRTGSTLTLHIDDVLIASATQSSFTTATVYPWYTTANTFTATVVLIGRPSTIHTGFKIRLDYESNGEPMDITSDGSGEHSLSQVKSFKLRTGNINAGNIVTTLDFPVTDVWSTWSIHGIAIDGGVGDLILTTAETASVRDYLISAVNVVACRDFGDTTDFGISRSFYAFHPPNVPEASVRTLASDVLISNGASGTGYAEVNTWIGPKLSGDFELTMELQSLTTGSVFGLRTLATATGGSQHTNAVYGLQYLSATEVRVWELGEAVTYTAAWTNGKVKLARTGSALTLTVDNTVIASGERLAFGTADVYPSVTMQPNAGDATIFRNQSGEQEYIGTNMILGELLASRKELQDTLTYASTLNIDFDTRTGDNKRVVLGGNVTTSTLAATRPGRYTLVAVQDAGSNTFAHQAGIVGTAPTLASGAGESTLFPLYFDGTSWFWS
jgi:hypothetical protein